MDKFMLSQFQALVRREIIEHKGLFIGAPAVLGGFILLFTIWVMRQLDNEIIAGGVEYLSVLFDGLSPVQMAPMFMVLALPFVITLYSCAFVYLVNCLYQDRKDMSILFWQSMPVSNLQTVLSKILTLAVVVPVFYIAVIFLVYLVTMVLLTILGLQYDVQVAGLGYMFMASVVSLVLVYLSAVTTALWLLPSIGWLLLFSAFSRRMPFMWALVVFLLIGFIEDFVFRTQYLANWVESRSNPNQYVIFQFSDLIERWLNYDMLFGVLVGTILITGAVYMRRFID